jgi:hypothetical protein
MLCPICSADFQLSEANCPACGCGLIPASLEAAPELETDSDEGATLVELCRPRLYSLAMLIKQTLDQNGVPAMVLGGNAFSVMPHLAFSGEMRIMVSSAQLTQARELYEAYFQNDGETCYEEE